MNSIQAVPRISADIVEITPALAKQYLESNIKNRPIRRRYVAELAEAMERGEWQLNGETVKFSQSGVLLDGQHRLSAVVMANVTVKMVVVYDVPDDAFATIDLNRKRTSADALSIAGYPNANVIAAAIRMVLILTTEPFSIHTQFSHVQIKEWADAFHEDLQPLLKLGKIVARANLLTVPYATALAYLFHEKNPDQTNRFFARLADGVGMNEGDPILALRNRLSVNATSSAKLPVRDIMAMCIKAWNYTREGKELSIMGWRADEGFPTIK